MQIDKACACGARYVNSTWGALALVGYVCCPADATGPADHLELRNCPCGSTIAVDAHPEHDDCNLKEAC